MAKDMRLLTPIALLASVLVTGCTPFGDAYGPDAGKPLDGGASDAAPEGNEPVTGHPRGAPDAPSGTAAAPINAVVKTLAGGTQGFADGVGVKAHFDTPNGVAVDSAGNVYVADTGNNRIRKVTATGVVTTVAGSEYGLKDGLSTQAQFNSPGAVALDDKGTIYVADSWNDRIRKVTAAGVVSTFAGSGAAPTVYRPASLTFDSAGNLYVVDGFRQLLKVTGTGVVSKIGALQQQEQSISIPDSAAYVAPGGVAVDSAGNFYFADIDNHCIKQVTAAGVVTTVAGSEQGFADGVGVKAQFISPSGIAIDGTGGIYVADENRIRKLVAGGRVMTVAGTVPGYADGVGVEVQFSKPRAVAVDDKGTIYVADTGNHVIRKIASGSGQLKITWNASGWADVRYTVSAAATNQPTKTCSTVETSCLLNGLASGETYTVTVTATNNDGTSSPSAPTTATPN